MRLDNESNSNIKFWSFRIFTPISKEKYVIYSMDDVLGSKATLKSKPEVAFQFCHKDSDTVNCLAINEKLTGVSCTTDFPSVIFKFIIHVNITRE